MRLSLPPPPTHPTPAPLALSISLSLFHIWAKSECSNMRSSLTFERNNPTLRWPFPRWHAWRSLWNQMAFSPYDCLSHYHSLTITVIVMLKGYTPGSLLFSWYSGSKKSWMLMLPGPHKSTVGIIFCCILLVTNMTDGDSQSVELHLHIDLHSYQRVIIAQAWRSIQVTQTFIQTVSVHMYVFITNICALLRRRRQGKDGGGCGNAEHPSYWK